MDEVQQIHDFSCSATSQYPHLQPALELLVLACAHGDVAEVERMIPANPHPGPGDTRPGWIALAKAMQARADARVDRLADALASLTCTDAGAAAADT